MTKYMIKLAKNSISVHADWLWSTGSTLEDLCTRKSQSSRGGCSRRVDNMDLAGEKENTFLNNQLLEVFC